MSDRTYTYMKTTGPSSFTSQDNSCSNRGMLPHWADLMGYTVGNTSARY